MIQIICAFFKELEAFLATTFPNGLDEFGDFISYSLKKTKGARQVWSPFFLDRSWGTVIGWKMADGVCGLPTFVRPNSVSWPGNLTTQQVGALRVVRTDNG